MSNGRSPQEACLQGNLVAICLEQLSDPHPLLRQWVAICLGRVWQNFDSARWCGVRDSAHEKLCNLLSDPIPEVSIALAPRAWASCPPRSWGPWRIEDLQAWVGLTRAWLAATQAVPSDGDGTDSSQQTQPQG